MMTNFPTLLIDGADDLFETSTPKVVQRGIIEDLILPAYSVAEDKMTGLHPSIQHDRYMSYVHDEIQNNLLNLIGIFPDQLVAFPMLNVAKSAHYVEVRSGSLIFTASQNRLRKCPPADARFRSA